MEKHGLSEGQACKVLNLGRSVFQYRYKRPDDDKIERELLALAAQKPRRGFWQCVRLLEKGWS